ncbi:dTDP-3-amino-3,4,6-trideoxy-alpha-D-glucopyranose [compost metagenome]
MMNSFRSYSKYYDKLYYDKNYDAETDYLIQLITRYNENAKQLIDLGCGTGKHAKLLAGKGYEITGLDQSEEMIHIARINSSLHFILGDITDFKLDMKFDVALSVFHVFSYLTENEDLLNAFINIHKHLKEKGIFILDVWHTPAVHSQIPEARTKIVETKELQIIRHARPTIFSDSNLVNVQYELKIVNKQTGEQEQIIEDHVIRHFSKPEIELLAKCTGFKVLHSEEMLTANPPSEKTWGVCYILQKNPLITL